MSADLISLYTKLILDIANIVVEYIPKLYIYHISREYVSWSGGYSEFIVVGESEDFVKYVHPNGSIINPKKDILHYSKESEISEYNPETYGADKETHTKNTEQRIFNLYFDWPNSFWFLPTGIEPTKINIKLLGQAIGDYQNGQVIIYSYDSN